MFVMEYSVPTVETERPIHPAIIKLIGKTAAIVLLGIARDLRSGVIPPEKLDMGFTQWWNDYHSEDDADIYDIYECGTPCCILGHFRARIRDVDAFRSTSSYPHWTANSQLQSLFGGDKPSNPQLAAKAIERFVYDNAKLPWSE